MKKLKLFNALEKDTWVKPFLKKYRHSLLLAIFLGFMMFFCAGALMFTSGYLISRAATLPENIIMIYVPIVLTRTFGIGRPVFHYIERLTSHNWVLKMTSSLRLKLYKSLETDAIFFKSHYRTGDILGLLAEDINHLQNLYLTTIFPTIIAWLIYIIVVIAFGLFSWPFALLMFILLGGLVILCPLWSVIINGAKQEREKSLKNNLYTDLTDNILGVSDWIFSQRGQDYVKSHENDEEKFADINNQIKGFNFKRDFVVQLIIGVITVSLMIWTGIVFSHSQSEANWIAAFVLSVFPLVDAFTPMSAAAQESNIYVDSIDRLNSLKEDTKNYHKPDKLFAPYELDISHLLFKYPQDNRIILNDLSLKIESGEKLAILGRSGSGKSTLANLIRGDLKPAKGKITLNGIDTYKFGDDISNYIGVINQSPYLFNTTILNNLRIGRQNATEAEVWDVLDRVGLKAMVQELPQGLNTMVDEVGMRFSGGERHRMALARILLKNTPIILLDEPTVGLDPITEQSLLNTFNKQLKGKTVIWITHHLQGTDMMDKIIFIEDGKLDMVGTPTELAKNNDRYKRLKAIDNGL